jgi:hypothetical protein
VTRTNRAIGPAPLAEAMSYSSPGTARRAASAIRNPSPIRNNPMMITAHRADAGTDSHDGVGSPSPPSSRLSGP